MNTFLASISIPSFTISQILSMRIWETITIVNKNGIIQTTSTSLLLRIIFSAILILIFLTNCIFLMKTVTTNITNRKGRSSTSINIISLTILNRRVIGNLLASSTNIKIILFTLYTRSSTNLIQQNTILSIEISIILRTQIIQSKSVAIITFLTNDIIQELIVTKLSTI